MSARFPLTWLMAFAAIVGLGCRPTPRTGDAAATLDAGPARAKRTSGAEITIQVNDQSFKFWSVNPAFIDKAIALRDAKKPATIMFERLLDETDCDPRWTFHVDPAEMGWPQLTTEVCDGRPSDIEGDKKHWINDVKRWCPWSSLVTSVDDRRGK